MPLQITDSIVLHDNELDERFVRASGPGGQNVTKVSTAVQLRFDVGRSSLPDEVRERLRTIACTRMTDEDVLVIDARTNRTQVQNREEARERLVEFIRTNRNLPPRELQNALLEAITAFGGGRQDDDLTCVIALRKSA